MKDSFSYMFMGPDFKRQRTVFIVKFIANVFTFAWQAEDEMIKGGAWRLKKKQPSHVRMCVEQFFADDNLWQKTLVLRMPLFCLCPVLVSFKTKREAQKICTNIFYARGICRAGGNILCRNSMAVTKQIRSSGAQFLCFSRSYATDKENYFSFYSLASFLFCVFGWSGWNQIQQQMGYSCKHRTMCKVKPVWVADKSILCLFIHLLSTPSQLVLWSRGRNFILAKMNLSRRI